MKRILMRSVMNPLENPPIEHVVTRNLIGGNAGNMIFVYSVMRTLMCEDTQIDTIKTLKEFSNEEVEKINSEYDCFILPLANAFRGQFMKELTFLISLIKRLKIPCIVIGVGVQAGVDENFNRSFEFDDLAKEFSKEVLKRSEIIGVRGEMTAAYMKKLGFCEEKDFTVIGCPSMYIHGDEVPLKSPVDLTPNSLVSVNRKINIPAKLQEFIVAQSEKFKNYMYVPQGIDDLLLLYAGVSINRQKYPNIHENYPWQHNSKICATGHEIGFANVPSWFDFLSKRDFSFGTRIHGNIAAVMSGTPAYIFAPDSRILELAKYHNIQHMLAKDITEDTDIFNIYEKSDFYSVQKGHKERFNHYVDFLEKNKLDNIFSKNRSTKLAPFDEKIRALDIPQGIQALSQVSIDEQAERLDYYYKYLDRYYKHKFANQLRKAEEYDQMADYVESLGFARKLHSFTMSIKNPKLMKLIIQEKLGKDVTKEAEKVKREIQLKKNKK